MNWAAKLIGGRFHYGWLTVAVVFLFLVLLAAAGTRATPSVMMVPLEHQFGWSRATISLAISVNIALYGRWGRLGPFAAAPCSALPAHAAHRARHDGGRRRTIFDDDAPVADGADMGRDGGWCDGRGPLPLSTTVMTRWFTTRRGLVMGILTASSATGQLVFLPMLAAIAEHHGWRQVVWVVAIVAAIVLPLVAFLLPERPADMKLRPYGEPADAPISAAVTKQNPLAIAFGTLAMASKTRDFWLLFSASSFAARARTATSALT